MNTARIICDKTVRNPEGKYIVYLAVELEYTDVVKALNDDIVKDNKLLEGFEYDKFKQIFKEEMKKNFGRK